MGMFSGLSVSELVVFGVSLLISMSAHEMMHGFTAHWLGDTTAEEFGRLTLNPLKHVDLYTTIVLPFFMVLVGLPPLIVAKPVPFNPEMVKYKEYGVALVGIAGPLTNLVLAIIMAIFLHLTISSLSFALVNYLEIFVEVNVLFFVFNMIPIPPLDGSRLLYAFAPEPLQRVMQRIESFGFVSIIIIFLLVFTLISPIIISMDTHIMNLLLG